jgi:hypothetical protein
MLIEEDVTDWILNRLQYEFMYPFVIHVDRNTTIHITVAAWWPCMASASYENSSPKSISRNHQKPNFVRLDWKVLFRGFSKLRWKSNMAELRWQRPHFYFWTNKLQKVERLFSDHTIYRNLTHLRLYKTMFCPSGGHLDTSFSLL